MLPVLDVPKSPRSFENADHLVGYMEFRLQTERALITIQQLAQLGYLAAYEVLITKREYEKPGRFVSLHDHDYANLVPIARKRITQGLVPPDWLVSFHRLMELKD